MRYVNLHQNIIKILEIHYSYNKQLDNDENEKYIAKIENVLKFWRSWNLSLEDRITVFIKTIFSIADH